MRTTLYSCLVFALSQCLLACSGQIVNPEKHQRTLVNEAHSIFIAGGVLKVFSDTEENILFVYVRPEKLDHWVATGGGGGSQSNPWQYTSASYWAQSDGSGWYPKDAPRKGFGYTFDSEGMTLTLDSGTYAVRRGELIVISLNENWQPGAVESGLTSLRMFDVSVEERKRLQAAVRKKNYRGS